MKINNYLPLAIATLAIAAGNTALGGISQQYYSANTLTFSLILTSQGEGNYSENGNTVTETATVTQERISNVEILKVLRNAGVIANISGWSIVAVSSPEGGLDSFYITKTGREPINIDGFMSLNGLFGPVNAGTYTGNSTTTYSESGYDTSEAYSHTLFAALVIGEEFESSLALIYFGNLKYNSLTTYSYLYDGPSQTTHSIRSFNMSNGTGIGALNEGFENFSVLGGKIVGSAAGVPIYLNF